VTGKLYLIPTFIGSENPMEVFPSYNTEIIKGLRHFIVEDERTARRFLKKVLPEIEINSLTFYVLNEHSDLKQIGSYIDACISEDIGLLSEAGVPCVADPGSVIVKMAHEKGIVVTPLIGPSSILLALMASGLNGQNFAFLGYLPIAKNERKKAIKQIENRSFNENQTQIFIEAPYRNNQLFEDIVANAHSDTSLCIACDVTLPSQMIITNSVNNWKNKKPDLHKRPVIFLLKKG
jgi:16S rRNA (cytidine1402-2'-O)-methyltransferase